MSRHENYPLAPLTTLGVGGLAHYYRRFSDEETLRQTLDFAEEHNLPVFLLGGGSNVVISEAGFPGVVLQPHVITWDIGQIVQGRSDRVVISVAAGANWDTVVEYCVRRDLAGIECLAGIPGQAGGTPVQNVGAYGQEVAETILSVDAYDRRERRVVRLQGAECGFAYRRSRFNHDEPGRWMILSVAFVLRAGGPPTVKYTDLQNHFGDGATPSLIEVANAVRAIRSQKGMVLDATDSDTRSAGSFFKNPTLTNEKFAAIQEQASQRGIARIPNYPQSEGSVKLPAAFLMEKSGLKKGQSFGKGRVSLSSKHILALTNRGGATGEDIAAAAREIQVQVEDTWGILLAPEPVFVGFPDPGCLPQSATVAGASPA